MLVLPFLAICVLTKAIFIFKGFFLSTLDEPISFMIEILNITTTLDLDSKVQITICHHSKFFSLQSHFFVTVQEPNLGLLLFSFIQNFLS